MKKFEVGFTAVLSLLMSWLGILAIPMLLLVCCSVVDYFTGIVAAKYRNETVSSYKGIRGIGKKVCTWLLVGVGAMIDVLINYAGQYIGMDFTLPLIVATVVAIWLWCNEIISILENILDIGVELPPFLLPLAKNIKKQVESKSKIQDTKNTEELVPIPGVITKAMEVMKTKTEPEENNYED